MIVVQDTIFLLKDEELKMTFPHFRIPHCEYVYGWKDAIKKEFSLLVKFPFKISNACVNYGN